MKILLIGATGQLGHDLQAAVREPGSRDEIVPLTHQQLDIRDAGKVSQAVEQTRPQCIVNTAAFHRVDLCEDERENAFAVNEAGVLNVARAAQKAGALLVQFSTDYVFDGAKKSPYVEGDEARPLSVYGKSRLAGECAVESACQRYLLIRTCGLYGVAGSQSKAGNFVETMLRLGAQKKPLRVVNDQVCTPTSTWELARRLLPLVDHLHGAGEGSSPGSAGLFHLTNRGQCSWYEFAQEIFLLAGMAVELTPCTTAEYAAKAARPAYSVLANRALRAAGFEELTPWQEALARYLRSRR